jgi:hypothetical protein
MTTRAQLLTSTRAELNDAGVTKLWSDALLQQWLAEAIRSYSARLPKEATTTLSSVAGQAAYALPSDFARVVRVEHPTRTYRVCAPLVGGDAAAEVLALVDLEASVQAAGPYTYDLYGGSLVLDPAPAASGESIVLRYLATYAEPSADGDTLATPVRDDDLLIWWVCARALDWISTDEAKRMRFERQRGASAAPTADRYLIRFDAGVRQRRQVAGSRRLVVRG